MERLRISLRRTDVTPVPSVRKISGAVLAALLLLFGLGFSVDSAMARALEKEPLTFVTASGKKQITVEVADTDQARAMGLMFRRELGADEGMIFLYPEDGPISMWMKNTYLALDMIFVRADGTIHRIEEHTEPFSERTISSQGTVRAVI